MSRLRVYTRVDARMLGSRARTRINVQKRLKLLSHGSLQLLDVLAFRSISAGEGAKHLLISSRKCLIHSVFSGMTIDKFAYETILSSEVKSLQQLVAVYQLRDRK